MEAWEAREKMLRENAAVTPAVRAANASAAERKAAVNLHVAQSLLAGLNKVQACEAAVAAGHDEYDADNCPAMSDADDRDMLEWYVERNGRA